MSLFGRAGRSLGNILGGFGVRCHVRITCPHRKGRSRWAMGTLEFSKKTLLSEEVSNTSCFTDKTLLQTKHALQKWVDCFGGGAQNTWKHSPPLGRAGRHGT